jgi:hypothetical protein
MKNLKLFIVLAAVVLLTFNSCSKTKSYQCECEYELTGYTVKESGAISQHEDAAERECDNNRAQYNNVRSCSVIEFE